MVPFLASQDKFKGCCRNCILVNKKYQLVRLIVHKQSPLSGATETETIIGIGGAIRRA